MPQGYRNRPDLFVEQGLTGLVTLPLWLEFTNIASLPVYACLNCGVAAAFHGFSLLI